MNPATLSYTRLRYALAAGLIHATYIEATEADGAKESALLRLLPLGADLSGWPAEQQPRLALCLRPYVMGASSERR